MRNLIYEILQFLCFVWSNSNKWNWQKNASSDEYNVVFDGNAWTLCVVNIVRIKSTTENDEWNNRGNETMKRIAACCNDESDVVVGFWWKNWRRILKQDLSWNLSCWKQIIHFMKQSSTGVTLFSRFSERPLACSSEEAIFHFAKNKRMSIQFWVKII